jgi:2-polyprenyl-6-methoxyphenol hydroxylase-like FAD-dependent oxidoreductase
MLDDLKKVSNPCAKIDYIRDDLTKIGIMNSGNNKERYGYDAILIARPDFYNVLLSKIPKERIHWGKRVVQFHQSQDGVQVECQDNLDDITGSEATVIYKGDILIGADGAYSAIRRGLYDGMIKQGIQLPAEDLEGLRFDSNCVIGTTEVLSEEEYPALKKKSGDFHVILGKERAIQVGPWFTLRKM